MGSVACNRKKSRLITICEGSQRQDLEELVAELANNIIKLTQIPKKEL